MILSAPYSQQLFTAIADAWPRHVRALGIAATAGPVLAALVWALARIRERRPLRYAALGLGLAIGAGYTAADDLSFAESFHFVEYGLLGWLWSRALAQADGRPAGDASSIVLPPLMAGAIVGTVDEWFQWFIPIRAGEARDVALNVIASGCGLLFAVALDPPARWTVMLGRESAMRLARWMVAAAAVFALFFQTVHVGRDVTEAEVGSFRSRYTGTELAAAARERTARWRTDPPLVQRRLSREDQYLTEGLWHVRRRNETWEAGDARAAWRENLILEKFYAPVLDTPSYAGAEHRWPAAQREEAAQRTAGHREPSASDAYAYPLYVWPWRMF
ncbi:MAG: VanZ family protein [Acidobacteria bacterium]|nr:VanZ family protein [Acidobacteriota bacterium]